MWDSTSYCLVFGTALLSHFIQVTYTENNKEAVALCRSFSKLVFGSLISLKDRKWKQPSYSS